MPFGIFSLLIRLRLQAYFLVLYLFFKVLPLASGFIILSNYYPFVNIFFYLFSDFFYFIFIVVLIKKRADLPLFLLHSFIKI